MSTLSLADFAPILALCDVSKGLKSENHEDTYPGPINKHTDDTPAEANKYHLSRAFSGVGVFVTVYPANALDKVYIPHLV